MIRQIWPTTVAYFTALLTLLHTFIEDFRYGLRSIKRCKGVAAGVVISMGLGIGATASLFSFVDFFALRPLPVPETNQVVRLANFTTANSLEGFSYPEYQDYVYRSQAFSGIVTYQNVTAGLAVNPTDQPRVALAALVSGNFFSTLQVKPAIGRGFLQEDDSLSGRDAVAVVSYAEWQRDFGRVPDAVGRAIAINGHSFTIIGVAPKEFLGIQPVVEPDIYLPRMVAGEPYGGMDPSTLTNRSMRFANLLARLKPGVTVEQATQDTGRIASQLEQEHPETNKGMKTIVLTQFAYRHVREDDRRLPVLLVVVVLLVLGIACVNVSNLLLSTVPARTGEMAVRIAMGAPRARLIRQLLLESIILSGAGTLLGLVIASWCAAFLSSIRIGSDLSLGFHIQVDERVVLFTLAVGMIAAFISGAVPAWRCSRGDLNSLLKSSDPRNRPQKIRGRQILAAAQVAVTTLVLVFSALFLKELQLAATRNPGFRVDHVLTMTFDPSTGGYNREQTLAFYNQLVERVRTLQGVVSAAIAEDKPFGVINNGSTDLVIDGYDMPADQQFFAIRSTFVSDGYFETLNIPIIRGRAFDRRDGVNGPRTVIINEAMAQRYWPNRDPIGARVVIKGDGGGPAQVVGIARNSKYASMSEPPSMPFIYRSFSQGSDTVAVLLVQTSESQERLTSAIRMTVRSIGPNVPIFDTRTMQNHFQEYALLEPRLTAQVFAAVGTVGLILGVLGLYGVIAYSVSQRTHEIGIRMVVGASDRQVLRMILLQGLRSSGIAAVAGIGLALAFSGMTQGVVSNVNPEDPTIYAGVLLLMLLITGAACYIPARRASMVDPNITLRS